MSINLKEAVSILCSNKGATPISILTQTVPDLKGGKKCPLLVNPDGSSKGEIVKHSYVNGIINFLYENSVNNQREREMITELFQSEPRKWGERLLCNNKLLPFVHHVQGAKFDPTYRDILAVENLPEPEKLYLEIKIQGSLSTRYFQNNIEIPAELVKPHLRDRDMIGRQGVEKPVILRDYKLSNLKSMSVSGKFFEILDGATLGVVQ